MIKIFYPLPLVKQDLQECVQASTVSLLAHYGIEKNTNQVKKEVPVYKTHDGKLLGSSLGHIALYFQKLGFKTTIHTTDIQIFDRSWSKLVRPKLIENLKQRRQNIRHPIYDELAIKAIFDGYIKFLEAKGKIVMPVISEKYLLSLLKNGPIFSVVSYNFLNQTSKFSFDSQNQKHIKDSINGIPSTHAVVINGFNNNSFNVIDPDLKFGGKRQIKPDLLIGSIYLAETDYDNLLITIQK